MQELRTYDIEKFYATLAKTPRQNEKPVATKISGKEILEAIRLMDANERRELTRALFA